MKKKAYTKYDYCCIQTKMGATAGMFALTAMPAALLLGAVRGGYVRRSRYPHCQSRAAQRLWDAFAGGEGKAVGLFQRPCHQHQRAP